MAAGRLAGNLPAAARRAQEEANRRLIACLTRLHLAPAPAAAANLLAETVPAEPVVVTGNTVIDALLWSVTFAGGYAEPALAVLDRDDGPVLLATAHRRESWGEPMRQIGAALAELADAEPGLRIVIPVHRNPRCVRRCCRRSPDGPPSRWWSRWTTPTSVV